MKGSLCQKGVRRQEAGAYRLYTLGVKVSDEVGVFGLVIKSRFNQCG